MLHSGLPNEQDSHSRLFDVIAATLCFAAGFVAWQRTHDLHWPCESDLYRDLGVAQSFLDGNAGLDPAYVGERWWYPPLVPAIVALTSSVFGIPLHRAYTTAGIYLNLLAPVCFYAMVAGLFNRRVALTSLIGFLFLGQLDWMSWLHATYSPWLWSCNLAQAFFYITMLIAVSAVRSGRRVPAAAAGVTMGLTALAHVAPAILLAGVVIVMASRECVASRFQRPTLLKLLTTVATIGVIAALVASPFWVDILVHYKLHVRNAAPLKWLASELSIERFGELCARLVSVRGCGAIIGLIGLMLPTREMYGRTAKSAALTWAVLASAGLGYGFLAQRVTLPPLFPSWHFYFYLQAFESLAFGVGVWTFLLVVRAFATRVWPAATPAKVLVQRGFDIALALLVAFVGLRWQRYAERPDLVANRAASFAYSHLPDIQLYRWALRKARPEDVVLAESNASFFVAAADRKVVALQELFSNPYVRLSVRLRDATAMLDGAKGLGTEAFGTLAAAYSVRYVALPRAARSDVERAGILRRVKAANDPSGIDVYDIVSRPADRADDGGSGGLVPGHAE